MITCHMNGHKVTLTDEVHTCKLPIKATDENGYCEDCGESPGSCGSCDGDGFTGRGNHCPSCDNTGACQSCRPNNR